MSLPVFTGSRDEAKPPPSLATPARAVGKGEEGLSCVPPAPSPPAPGAAAPSLPPSPRFRRPLRGAAEVAAFQTPRGPPRSRGAVGVGRPDPGWRVTGFQRCGVRSLLPGPREASCALASRARGVTRGGFYPPAPTARLALAWHPGFLPPVLPAPQARVAYLSSGRHWPGVTQACQLEGPASQPLACKMDKAVRKLGRASRSVRQAKARASRVPSI